MESIFPINLVIGDRTYRVKVAPQDEETVRKTVKLINEKILEFKTNFSGKDMQDYIAMVVLWFATQSPGNTSQDNEIQSIESLKRIEALLDKALEG